MPNVTTKYSVVYQNMLQNIQSGSYASTRRLPSEKELAAEFGVSVGTMTRALETLVRDGVLTRRRGSGTFVADTKRKSSSVRMMFVVPHHDTNISEHTYFGPIFDAFCRVCFANYASIEVTYVPMDSWLELPERFPDSAFFFVSPDRDTHNILTELWHRKPCFVVTGASWELPVPFPTVDSENRGSVRRAVEYLLHLGHRRIALVNGEDESANCRDRQHGYEDALTAWDVNIEPEWEIAAGGSMTLSATARNQLADLLLARTAPTAVFCAGYYLALEVMGVASRFGISLPDQLSLVAVDDPISASYLKPSLTTLRQPLAQIGARGAERLLALMQNGMPDTPLAEFLPCELILRDSCVAPRAAAPGQILELPGQRR